MMGMCVCVWVSVLGIYDDYHRTEIASLFPIQLNTYTQLTNRPKFVLQNIDSILYMKKKKFHFRFDFRCSWKIEDQEDPLK